MRVLGAYISYSCPSLTGEGARNEREGFLLPKIWYHFPMPTVSETINHSETNVRVRFAPSRPGRCISAASRTALWDWLYARHTGGTFVLRVEDTDKNRETADGVQVILDSLAEYGLQYDEGPGVGGPHAPYIPVAALRHLPQVRRAASGGRQSVPGLRHARRAGPDARKPAKARACRRGMTAAIATSRAPSGPSMKRRGGSTPPCGSPCRRKAK